MCALMKNRHSFGCDMFHHGRTGKRADKLLGTQSGMWSDTHIGMHSDKQSGRLLGKQVGKYPDRKSDRWSGMQIGKWLGI